MKKRKSNKLGSKNVNSFDLSDDLTGGTKVNPYEAPTIGTFSWNGKLLLWSRIRKNDYAIATVNHKGEVNVLNKDTVSSGFHAHCLDGDSLIVEDYSGYLVEYKLCNNIEPAKNVYHVDRVMKFVKSDTHWIVQKANDSLTIINKQTRLSRVVTLPSAFKTGQEDKLAESVSAIIPIGNKIYVISTRAKCWVFSIEEGDVVQFVEVFSCSKDISANYLLHEDTLYWTSQGVHHKWIRKCSIHDLSLMTGTTAKILTHSLVQKLSAFRDMLLVASISSLQSFMLSDLSPGPIAIDLNWPQITVLRDTLWVTEGRILTQLSQPGQWYASNHELYARETRRRIKQVFLLGRSKTAKNSMNTSEFRRLPIELLHVVCHFVGVPNDDVIFKRKSYMNY